MPIVIVTSPAGCSSVASVTLIENVISSNVTVTSTTASVFKLIDLKFYTLMKYF